MTVIALNRRTAERIAELDTEPTGYVTLSPGARNAMTALEGRVAQLRRIFAGPSTPAAMAAQIEQLTLEIRTEAQRIARLSK
jgi:hypothetical protein